MIIERYRKDYAGEFIITQTSWSGGKKRTQREWMPNPIENHHISGRAACIGSTVDRSIFDFTVLTDHKGGLLGSLKLQTYGTGEIAKLMRLDFAVEKDSEILADLVNQHYYKDYTIYTTPRNCLAYPGAFYTIPFNPPMLNSSLLPYLAAFDGHKEIFLLGYNEEAELGQNDWTSQIERIIATYPSAKFFHVVSQASQTPDAWKNYNNFVQLTQREFVYYADI